MTILLTLLSLCATECRVHRAYELRDDGSINIRIGCMYKLDDTGGAVGNCLQQSHWLPCTVVEKCDTTWTIQYGVEQTSEGTRATCDSFPIIRCHPDTLVDSVPRGIYHWPSLVPKGAKIDSAIIEVINRPEWRSNDIDSAELADIREMLREWRVEKCYKTTIDSWKRWDIFYWEKQAILDSCACLYQNKGEKK